LSRGNHPFIIVTQNGLDAGILEGIIANKAIPLKKISFPETGYELGPGRQEVHCHR